MMPDGFVEGMLQNYVIRISVGFHSSTIVRLQSGVMLHILSHAATSANLSGGSKNSGARPDESFNNEIIVYYPRPTMILIGCILDIFLNRPAAATAARGSRCFCSLTPHHRVVNVHFFLTMATCIFFCYLATSNGTSNVIKI